MRNCINRGSPFLKPPLPTKDANLALIVATGLPDLPTVQFD